MTDRHTNRQQALESISSVPAQGNNIRQQSLTIGRAQRERKNGHRGKVIWLTGLSGSGKSTIANALEISLHQDGIQTFVLDGDNLRQGLNKDLSFSEADRIENIRRVAEVSRLMLLQGTVVIASFISPYISERQKSRDLIGVADFIEIYVNAPLKVCEKRDVKGLYKKARRGEIQNFTGIDSPYEPPTNPALSLNTSEICVDDAVNKVRTLLAVELSTHGKPFRLA